MSCKEKIPFTIKGRLEICDPKTGKIVFEKDNLVVDKAVEITINRLKDNSTSFLDYIAIGDGITAPAITDTTLSNELFRKQVDNKNAGLTTLTVEVTILDSEANFTWKELAVFNANSGGDMFNRIAVDFAKTALDSFLVRFIFTFARS